MPRGIEIAQPEREVDRVDVFERRRERRQVRRQIGSGDATPTGHADTSQLGIGSVTLDLGRWSFAGRRRTPSFRLPILYPCRSIVTCW